jgi:putative ABC transport system permease protein
MAYAVSTLWFERRRYFAGVLAVAFSCVLIVVQVGLLDGLMKMVSRPVDASAADIWAAGPKVPSCDLGNDRLERGFRNQLAVEPGVVATEEYVQQFQQWSNPNGGTVLCIVAGCALGDEAIGPAAGLSAELRERLRDPGAVAIDRADLGKLGIARVGETTDIGDERVRVVGLLEGMNSFTGPYVLCSVETARTLLPYLKDSSAVFLLAKCRDAACAAAVARNYAHDDSVSVYTKAEFSSKSKNYWIVNTRAGTLVAFVALLGLFIGAVITTYSLYGATVAALRELMVLRALGVPRWRISSFVVAQAAMVGLLGVAVGIPVSFVVGSLAGAVGIHPAIDPPLLLATCGVAWSMSALAGLLALRSLRGAEPANLLR